MKTNTQNWQWRCWAAAVLLLAASIWAVEGRAGLAKIGEYNPADQTVEMFAAIEKGDIAVRLIPKDSTQARVLIENKTNKPLNVKLPEAFAGVPVLAVQGAGGAGTKHGSTSSNSSSNKNQSTGGGMGGGGMGGGGGGMGMFNVPPEQVGQLKVATVCLEHGKSEPHAAVPYEIKPLDSVTSKPGVRELCELLGKGGIDQRAAQAAAWHLNNGMSWQELAAKRLRSANGTSRPYFSQQELQTAVSLVSAATRLAEERQKQQPSTQGSASRY